MSSEKAANVFGKDGLRWVVSFSETSDLCGREREGCVNNELVKIRWELYFG